MLSHGIVPLVSRSNHFQYLCYMGQGDGSVSKSTWTYTPPPPTTTATTKTMKGGMVPLVQDISLEILISEAWWSNYIEHNYRVKIKFKNHIPHFSYPSGINNNHVRSGSISQPWLDSCRFPEKLCLKKKNERMMIQVQKSEKLHSGFTAQSCLSLNCS